MEEDELMEQRPQPEKKFGASLPNVIPACLLLFNHFKARNNWKIFMRETVYQKI